jgi:hypothetical protein
VSRNSPAPRGSRRHITRLPVSDRQPFDGWHFTSFVVPNRGPNSAVRWWKSVPLARSLFPPDPESPFGSLSRQQVLCELRVILCQIRQDRYLENDEIRNFYPVLDPLSTGLFPSCEDTDYLVACFAQPRSVNHCKICALTWRAAPLVASRSSPVNLGGISSRLAFLP